MNSLYSLLMTTIGSQEWKDTVLQSLDIMWKGVLAIFIVIGLVVVAVVAMSAILRRLKNRKQEGENAE